MSGHEGAGNGRDAHDNAAGAGAGGGGRGIVLEGGGTFNNKLISKLSCAPADIMVFLEACAMGNLDRVDKLLEKGVVSCKQLCN